jgi:hypothetical protein
MIKVSQVFIDKEYPIQEAWIRGDLVRGIRVWHKGDKDMVICKGPMAQVTLYDHDMKMYHHVRIDEGAEQFSQRLYDFRITADKRAVAKQTG